MFGFQMSEVSLGGSFCLGSSTFLQAEPRSPKGTSYSSQHGSSVRALIIH